MKAIIATLITIFNIQAQAVQNPKYIVTCEGKATTGHTIKVQYCFYDKGEGQAGHCSGADRVVKVFVNGKQDGSSYNTQKVHAYNDGAVNELKMVSQDDGITTSTLLEYTNGLMKNWNRLQVKLVTPEKLGLDYNAGEGYLMSTNFLCSAVMK